MVVRPKEKYPAWERAPGESYEDFKKRFNSFRVKLLKNEYKKDEREMQKKMIFRAWDRMPGESLRDFKRRLHSEKRDKSFLI